MALRLRTAQRLLDEIEDTFEKIAQEEDEGIRDRYYDQLANLKFAVEALDQENKSFFTKVLSTVIRDKYRTQYEELTRIWSAYKRDSAKAAALRNEGTSSSMGHLRPTESSPSLGLPPQQQLQGYGSQTASQSTAAVHNHSSSPSRWATRIFQRRALTTDGSTYQSESPNTPGPNMAPSAKQLQAHMPVNNWGGQHHQARRGAPSRDRRTHLSPDPSMTPSAEQQWTHSPGNNWGGQQYHQPQHGRGAPTRYGSTHQFAPPNAPGPNVAPSSEQHRAYVPEHITTYQERQQVERQVDEEWERRPMMAQGPGRPGMGQFPHPNVLPQGQYSLPPPPRTAQRQPAFVQYEAQAQGATNAHAGPSHTRSQTVASGNTFGHGLPGQPGFSAYDRRGDSLDSDGNTIPRTSYSSEGSYQSHRYRQN
ncbi:hypothetical protein PILCRDRAFT_814273 [Piloderma croceum F 1598]|uniref:Uncharacterized protein n=1 Tax=Piloderma croceum (strain F 1598) TaxID=765440 RepID=A0A0C3G9F1_PILCF|nr:hypothetical protein PILCRDRAFT_814273 [Piloderma croceum F 1598]